MDDWGNLIINLKSYKKLSNSKENTPKETEVMEEKV